MKIDVTTNTPTIEATDLGPLLGLAPAEVALKMRDGEITSRFETGQDEDAGRFRLTFFYDGKRIRLTCDADGSVLSSIRTSDRNRS